jgi:hypothetical protein
MSWKALDDQPSGPPPAFAGMAEEMKFVLDQRCVECLASAEKSLDGLRQSGPSSRETGATRGQGWRNAGSRRQCRFAI